MISKLRVAVIGSGKVGCDFLVKALRSESIEVVLFAGRNESEGIIFAREQGVFVSTDSIRAVLDKIIKIDVVVDATNSKANIENFSLLKNHQVYILNLTPSGIGSPYVPNFVYDSNSLYHNFITCGAQSSLPILKKIVDKFSLKYIELVSTLSSNSVGLATRLNLSEYLETTSNALSEILSIDNVKTILTINPAHPEPPMRVSIYCKSIVEISDSELSVISDTVNDVSFSVSTYAQSYESIKVVRINDSVFCIQFDLLGLGDYCSSCAGNLDVITIAAIHWCEKKFSELTDNE